MKLFLAPILALNSVQSYVQNQLSYAVTVEYTSSAVLETEAYKRQFNKDDDFTQKYTEYSQSFQMGMSEGKLNAGFSESMTNILDTAYDTRDEDEYTGHGRSVQQPGHYQVWRTTTKNAMLDGSHLYEKVTEYVYSQAEPPTNDQLNQASVDFLNMYLKPSVEPAVTLPRFEAVYPAFLENEYVYLPDGVCVQMTTGTGSDATSKCQLQVYVDLVEHYPAFNVTIGPFTSKGQTVYACQKQKDFVKSNQISMVSIRHQPGCKDNLQISNMQVNIGGQFSTWTLDNTATYDNVNEFWTNSKPTNAGGSKHIQCGSSALCLMTQV